MHNIDFLEKRRNSAVKNYSAHSNLRHEQPKQSSCHLTHVCCLPTCTDEKCGENVMARANPGQKQIRHFLWQQ